MYVCMQSYWPHFLPDSSAVPTPVMAFVGGRTCKLLFTNAAGGRFYDPRTQLLFELPRIVKDLRELEHMVHYMKANVASLSRGSIAIAHLLVCDFPSPLRIVSTGAIRMLRNGKASKLRRKLTSSAHILCNLD